MASNFTLEDCIVHPHQQPCWDCVKAYGGCAWSSQFKPIPDWVARKIVKPDPKSEDGLWVSYAIKVCPEFEREAARGT